MLSVSSQRTDKSSKPLSFIFAKTRVNAQEASRPLILIIYSCNACLSDIYTYFNVIISDNGRVGAAAAAALAPLAHPDIAFEIHA